jgi:phosphonate transport system permease protein
MAHGTNFADSPFDPRAPGRNSGALPVDLPTYDRRNPRRTTRTLLMAGAVLAVLLFLMGSARLAEVDLSKLFRNVGKIGQWVGLMFPPYVDGFRQPPTDQEFLGYLRSAAQTVAIATIGITASALLALIPAVLATRTLTPSRLLYYPTRWFLNTLRAVDSFIFALYFVAAVGLGPFAGVLGVALHTWGTMAKQYADTLETLELSPMLAIEAGGVGRIKAIFHALVPDALPVLASVTLFWWEFTVRHSIALGIVGAGGIGQDVKNAIDLLNFPHLGVLILIIVAMVTVIDQISSRLRRALS